MTALNLQPFDVVVVPFPFTDLNASKRRPALVLTSDSFNQTTKHSVLAMITSAEQSSWPDDYAIGNLEAAGLPTDCVVRLKLFTLDHRLVVRKAGVLLPADQKQLRQAWKNLLAI